MSEAQLHPQENTEEQLIQNATWTAVFLSLAGFAFLGFALSEVNFQDWQDYVIVAFTLLLGVSGLVSVPILRRGNVVLGSGIVFIANLILPLVVVAFQRGIGWVVLVYVFTSSALIIWRALPRSSWRWAIATSLFAGVLILLLTIFEPFTAFDAPSELIVFIAIVTAILVAAVGFNVIRQAWNSNIQVKITTGFVLIAFISIAVVGISGFMNLRDQIREGVRQRLITLVTIAALQQDGDLHSTLQEPGDEESDAYRQLQNTNLAIIANLPEIDSMYTMRINEDNQIQFYVDTGQPGDDDLATLAEIDEDPTQLMLDRFSTLDEAIAEEEFSSDEWGTFLSAYAPFYNSEGEREGIVGVDIRAEIIVAEESDALALAATTSITALLAATIFGFVAGNRFTKPILNLSATAQKVADGNLGARAVIETKDEIGDLANTFNIMTAQLRETLNNLEQRITERTRALETSTEVGRRLSTILDQYQLVREVVDQVREAFDYYHAHIYLFDESKEFLIMVGGTGSAGQIMLEERHSVSKGRGLVGRAGDTNLPILVPDVTKADGWLPNPLLPETRAEAAIPIAIGDDVLGVLDVQENEVNGLTEVDVDLLQSIANQIAVALKNARAYQRTQKQVEREALMVSINQQIQSTTDVEGALQVAVRELGRVLGTATSISITRGKFGVETGSLKGKLPK